MKTRTPTSSRKFRNPQFSRRSLLAGLGAGAALAPFIPLLESHAEDSEFPKRLLLLWNPNGSLREHWLPSGTTDNFELGVLHAPLQAHKDNIIILDGVRLESEGPGSKHEKGIGCQWTGSALSEDDHGDASWAASISVDQVVAEHLANQTPFKSLEFAVQSNYFGNRTRMIYADYQAPISPETNPAAMFDRLFSGLDPDTSAQQRLRTERRSVIDMVRGDLNRLSNRYSGADRLKMDAHLDGIREVELRNETPIQTCGAPDQPSIPDHENPEFFPAISRDMIDQIVMAFSCDLTRVASLQWAHATSGLIYDWLGLSREHHAISHMGNDQQEMIDSISAIQTWYAGEVAYLLDRLASVPEGDGTMLDNTLVVWGNGLGRGNSHTHSDIPFVLAGGAGGAIQPGRFLTYENVPHNRLLVSILESMGVSVDSFGDNDRGTGGLPGLLT